MKPYSFADVALRSGFLKAKQDIDRNVTVYALYDNYVETGRIKAFEFTWKKDEPDMPHIFWDSDVAKWMEGAAYLIRKQPNADLEAKLEALIDNIEKHQGDDGYFNIHFTVVEPEKRFSNRDWHELYCAGHLVEAAVAYAEATGKERFLHCMEKYMALIEKVFIAEKSAAFCTPGHEELELALIKLYRYTGNRKYLDMAAYFINTRGTENDIERADYNQSHVPVREQYEAKGHSVRAMYLYTAMADAAYELKDEALEKACESLFEDVTQKKMYVTGGIGSCYLGECFTKPYDLPNAEAYTETCAGIGLMFFAHRMLRLHNKAKYADIIERALYNGVLSGISLDGKRYFYENPLEITLNEHFSNHWGSKRYPITTRPEMFGCSCCPPNLVRILASLGDYLYAEDGDTLYINQFAASTLEKDGVKCTVETDYPNDGIISVTAEGKAKIAVRVPSWCASFKANKPYTMTDGYAVFENDGEIRVEFDMTPFAVRSDSRVTRDVGRLCVMRGPVVYCAESVDNGENLHAVSLSPDFTAKIVPSERFGLQALDVSAYRDTFGGTLYARAKTDEEETPITLHMIPYCCFANRGESDMLVWLRRK